MATALKYLGGVCRSHSSMVLVTVIMFTLCWLRSNSVTCAGVSQVRRTLFNSFISAIGANRMIEISSKWEIRQSISFNQFVRLRISVNKLLSMAQPSTPGFALSALRCVYSFESWYFRSVSSASMMCTGGEGWVACQEWPHHIMTEMQVSSAASSSVL